MFLGRKTEKVPTRTFGKLSRNDKGELVFNYRPWLVLPQRTLVLPAGNYETGRGLFYSEILRVEGDSAEPSFCCRRAIAAMRRKSPKFTTSPARATSACAPPGRGSKACSVASRRRREAATSIV